MQRFFQGLLALCMALAPGCNDKPNETPAQDTPATRPSETGPTTRDLTEGPRSEVQLKVMPLAVHVPVGWKLNLINTPTVSLDGPAPHGDVQISLSTWAPMSAKRVELMMAGAKADAAKNPQTIKVSEARLIDGMQSFERLELPTAGTQPSDMPLGSGNGMIHPLVSWNIYIFVPRGDAFLPCEFSFIGLTSDQCTSDGPFLRAIIDSAIQKESPELPAP